MAKKSESKAETKETKANLPSVSKQTAGGITGAILGGVVGGPVGAVAGGVAGALVGDSSAKGNKPIKRAMDTIRSRLRGRKTAKTAGEASGGGVKKSKMRPAKKKRATKSSAPKKKTKTKTAPKKKKTAKKTPGSGTSSRKKK